MIDRVRKYLRKYLNKYSKRQLKQWAVRAGVALAAFAVFFAATGALAFAYFSYTLPPIEEINNRKTAESTKIYDRTGEVLLYEIRGEERRTIISSEDIPEYMKLSTIAAEDERFYENPAFDWQGILRGIWAGVSTGRFQGGSTITQQLAKNIFLEPKRNIKRKLKELVLAMRLEQTHTKDEILTLYLNQVPYGGNIYGIEAATQVYFGKPAKDLTLNESALLAALPKAPSYYSPWGDNVPDLISRKNTILQKMYTLGYIGEEEKEEAQKESPEIMPRTKAGIKAPHFVVYVQNYLQNKYGEQFLRTAGLKVTTTLNWEMQELAETAVKEGADRNTELYGGKNASLIALDPQNGEILSMVGSADYFDIENEGNFNVAVSGLRQPGSAFKPFVYTAAFQKGYSPETIVWDAETEFDTTGDPSRSYKPQNFDEKFRGPVTLKEGLAQSINVPSVKAFYLAGIGDSINLAENFGITTLKDRERFGLTLVLGGGEVKLIELASAYGVFAADGMKYETTPIIKIETEGGRILEEWKPKGVSVIDPQYPRLINQILSDSNLRAPLFQASAPLTRVSGYQVALKTGTTNNYIDAWAMGYAPNLVVGVWAGNNHREPLTARGSSILAAVPIWHDFMSVALPMLPLKTFAKPTSIEQSNIAVVRGEFPQEDRDNPHSILYYLSRLDDPQFENWELGLESWLKSNPAPDFSKFAVSGVAESSLYPARPFINLISPKNGEVVEGKLLVEANITSKESIRKIEVFLNDTLIDSKNGNWVDDYTYRSNFSTNLLPKQNKLRIVVTDESKREEVKEVIFYL